MINRSESELIARERRNRALRRSQGGRTAENQAFERAASRKAERLAERSPLPEPARAGPTGRRPARAESAR